ncbi:MAG: hypothetical protein KGV46_02560 [Pasteurella sp.]|nr:hypothetical protein [Pasteurella sp.]
MKDYYNENGLRIVKTARSKKKINKAARKGYYPLIKEVIPSKEIHSKYCVIQHPETNEIKVIGDARRFMGDSGIGLQVCYKTVIGWTSYYPYNFKSPFAAYLIPPDIKVGERVFVEDVIEDYVAARWNQGNTYRLESCEAIWNGEDLEIQYDDIGDRITMIG